jgi:hypothetical protein
LTLDNESIVGLLEQYEKESKAIKEEVLKICWYMRGSITYDDGMMLTQEDRKLISQIVKDNLETTKKSGLPFF